MSNPLIDDLNEAGAIPSVEIGFPTMGAFYPPGEVVSEDVDLREVPVRHISVVEESSFSDPLMLLSGKAVAKMIRRVCPTVIDPGRLCELDVQAILIGCRMASYGNTMRIKHTCPDCKNENEIEIDLLEHVQRFGPYTPEEIETFKVDLPTVGQRVHLRPMLYEDTVDMTLNLIRNSQGLERFQKASNSEALDEDFIRTYTTMFETSISTNIDALAASVMTAFTRKGVPVTDRSMLRDWLGHLPPDDLETITTRIAALNNDIRERSRIDYQCQSGKCGKTQTIYLELDPQKLFTRAGDRKTETGSSAKSKNTGKTTKTRSRVSQK